MAKRILFHFLFVAVMAILFSVPVVCADSHATNSAANLVVDMDSSQGEFIPMTDMSQGGTGEVTDPHIWASMFPLLKKISSQCIRINHIFDYYGIVASDSSGSLKYSRNRFDRIIEQIVAPGAKPYLCVSYLQTLNKNGFYQSND